jgi:epoxyqueuosine reductase
MSVLTSSELTHLIVEKAKSIGASIAGIADVESLKISPSQQIYPKIGMNLGVGSREAQDGININEVSWPEDAISVVVIGVAHKADEPELDWWDGSKGTPGNRILIRINKELSKWIENTFHIKTYKLPYHVEKGGIFLKDAAVMAGLGCIGKNNLVVTPEYGPRIRFRAMLLDRAISANGPIKFNPCKDCKQPCRKVCPLNAFQDFVYSAEKLEQTILPGIDGTYDRVSCNVRMEKDIEEGVMVEPEDGGDSYKCIKYCRRCELACPAGK